MINYVRYEKHRALREPDGRTHDEFCGLEGQDCGVQEDRSPEGEKIGEEIQRRHNLLLKFLTGILKIEFKTADEEACKMEHVLSMSSLQRFTDFMDFIHSTPSASDAWLNHLEKISTKAD